MPLEKTFDFVASKQDKIEVFGLGYVGFPLSIRLAKSNFKVLGIDKNDSKIKELENKILKGSQLRLKTQFLESIENGYFAVSKQSIKSDLPKVGIIAVPTPYSGEKINSDIFVISAVEEFLTTSNPGDVIILESSIGVGTTDKVEKLINSFGYDCGKNFGLCFCPERIDPLNKKWKLENIPRVIFASDDITFRIAQEIYKNVNNGNLIRVSSPKIAEVVKSFENTFRMVNISLVNELAILCDKLKINVKEVLDAASTKPFGFMPFYPGAGAGGHCIPKDPIFLLESAKSLGFNFSTIENAIDINFQVPKYIVNSIEKSLEELNLPKSVLVYGLSYKPDIEDMRDSPGFKILYELHLGNFDGSSYDPYFKNDLLDFYLKENHLERFEFNVLDSLSDKSIQNFSCICIVQNHSRTQSRLEEIYKNSTIPLIYDCTNTINFQTDSKTVLKGFGQDKKN